MKITNQVFDIVGRIARSFSRTTGLEYDDLYSEGLYAYCINARRYDPKSGAVTTFFYHVINNHMKNYVKKLNKHNKNIAHDVDISKCQVSDNFTLGKIEKFSIPDKFCMDMY